MTDDDALSLADNALQSVKFFTIAHTGETLAEVEGMEFRLWALAETEDAARAGLERIVRAHFSAIHRELMLP